MRFKIITGLAFGAIIFGISVSEKAAASDDPTMWEGVNKSMSAFLNEGWIVVSSSESLGWHTATWENSTIGVVAASPEINARYYNFVLGKQGKYVFCSLSNPQRGDARSSCRKLN